MITVSDNTATNMLIRLVHRGAINEEMSDLGLTRYRGYAADAGADALLSARNACS